MRRALFVLLFACGAARSPYALSMAAADRAATAGRDAEAAARYEEASASAQRPRDREHAAYLAALSWVRAGDVAKGAGLLASIARGAGEHAPEAALRLAIVQGETEDASAALEDVVARFPSSGSAHVALMKLLAKADERGDALAYIERLERGPLGSTEIAETLAYQRALRLDRQGKLAEARDAYVGVAARWPYPRGALFDDALWRASEADEKLGRAKDAIADLERMLEVRESSHFTGSYDRPRFPAALLRVGALWRDAAKDKDKARDAFHRAARELGPSSPLRDDALWQAAALEDAPCGTLGDLVASTPDSRYVPCALERCPALERPKKSGAPKECHPYLKRSITPER